MPFFIGIIKSAYRKDTKQMKKMYLAVLSFAIALTFGSLTLLASENKVNVTNQKINLMNKPLGVDQSKEPTFSWAMTDNQNNSKQTAYKISIYHEGSNSPVVETGWTQSDNSTGVHVAQVSQLKDNDLYSWTVQVKDNHGNTSGPSNKQSFTTKTDWQSKNSIWSLKNNSGVDANFVFARKRLNINNPGKIEKAVVSVAAKNNQETRQFVDSFYVNGKFVGEGPARNNGNTYYYNNYDITNNLRKGKNVIGALNYSLLDSGFLAQMTVYYKDGTKKIMTNSGVKNSGWQVYDGTKAFGDNGKDNLGTFYFKAAPQNINQKYFPNNWTNPKNTSNKGWKTPTSHGNYLVSSDQQLESYPVDNVQRKVIRPQSIKKLANGHYLIDMGKEIVGSFGLSNLNVKSDRTAEIRYGEELDGNSVKWRMRTTNNYGEFWSFLKGKQTVENTDLLTYRYVEISNLPADLKTNNVEGLALQQEFNDEASDFKSSDSAMNKEYELSKYSIKATNQDLMVDSQSRERGVYEGDTLINSLSSYSVDNNYALSAFSTEWGISNPTWPAEYGFFSVMNAWNEYLYTGDKTLLLKEYDALKASRNDLFTHDIDANGLVRDENTSSSTMNAVLVDWPQSERDDYTFGKYDTVLNALAYGAYRDMSKIADAVGNQSDKAAFTKYADNVKSGMIKNLYDSKKGQFKDSKATDHASEHAQAFPLAMGVYDTPEMAKNLTQKIDARGDGFHTSIYGAYFVLQGLYNGNDSQQATKLLNSTDIRSWLHVIDNLHSTITPEAWDPSLKPNMTFSHPWGSAPATQLIQGMFGLKPTAPGYKTFDVKVQPGNVNSAAIKVPTASGTIEVSYQMSGDKLTAKVTVPANTKATVMLPKANGTDYTKTELGSGTYSLSN